MLWRKGLPILATTAALAVPSAAGATTVTIGSQLTAPVNTGATCGASTFTNVKLASGLTAPFDGLIVRWRLNSWAPSGSLMYKLRVLHPNGDGSYRGAGTGPPQATASAGVNVLPLPAPLLIQAGDLVGIDCPNGAPSPYSVSAPPTSTFAFFGGGLADGASAMPSNMLTGQEELINADVATPPSNDFSLGAATRDKRRGTASLPVTVPGPGTISLSGTGVVAQQAGAGSPEATKSVSGPGTVNLLIQAVGKKKRKL
jgi:hypothetical protein